MENITGQRIKKEREARGWTQTYLAELMGFSDSSYISKIENSKRNVTPEEAIQLEKIFGKPVHYFLGGPIEYTAAEDQITNAVKEDPSLYEFWREQLKRDDLQLLFKQTAPLSPDAIKRIMKYIKMVEDEEAAEDN